ncbi:MAG: ABC transporter substrate-binding protein [Candidatus Binatia bacterium]
MANKKLKVAAGHYHLFHRVAPTIAKSKGYFANQGLDVEISATGTDAKSLQALIEEEMDIIIDLKTPVALRARDQGEEIFLVGGFLNTYPGIFVGAKGIRSVPDLKGKKVGIREPNGVARTLASMVLTKAGLTPERDVILVPNTGASSFKSLAPKLERGDIQARIAHRAFADDFRRAGFPVLADLAEYLPRGYQLRAIAAKGTFLKKKPEEVTGFLKGMIYAYRFMKDPSNHPEMMAIIQSSDLEFEEDMDQSMWEEEYPLIPGIPADGSVNAEGLKVILEEEKAAGAISQGMTVDKILQPEYVQRAVQEIGP